MQDNKTNKPKKDHDKILIDSSTFHYIRAFANTENRKNVGLICKKKKSSAYFVLANFFEYMQTCVQRSPSGPKNSGRC